MIFYLAVTTDHARRILDNGFVGVTRALYDTDELLARWAQTPAGERVTNLPDPISVAEYVECRAFEPSAVAEIETHVPSADGSPVSCLSPAIIEDLVADEDVDDFIVSIEVPDTLATPHVVDNDLAGRDAFADYWLPVDLANDYRHTIRAYACIDGEETRHDLVGK